MSDAPLSFPAGSPLDVLRHAVLRAASNAFSDGRIVGAEFRLSVVAFVREGKRAGMPSERILRVAKECVSEAAPPFTPREQLDDVSSHLVKWCIDEFYSTPTPPTGSTIQRDGPDTDTVRH